MADTPESWNGEIDAWDNKADAEAACAAANAADPNADAIVCVVTEIGWFAEGDADAEGEPVLGWGVTDGSGLFLLEPREVEEGEEDLGSAVAPAGHTWVYCR